MIDFSKLIQATLSRPIKKVSAEKITIVPLEIKGSRVYQFTIFSKNKAFHKNHAVEEAEKALSTHLENFKEAHFYTTDGDYLALKEKDGSFRMIKSKSTKLPTIQTHNRKKNYLLDEQNPFWQALGIANAQGKIKPDKQAKFRQVNRFIEIIADVIPHLPNDFTIIDFGCGKAYLSFALYHYLVNILKRSVKMIGIDLKQDVVDHLEQIRKDLGYTALQFFTGDIKTFPIPDQVDLVISLHACDTATDLVLARAIQAHAKAILAVPCCQHALYSQIKQPLLKPLLKHGILKERFAALATDALRASLLEISGYTTQVIEFIDTEHTPKNLLIKAIKSSLPPAPHLKQEHQAFLTQLGLSEF